MLPPCSAPSLDDRCWDRELVADDSSAGLPEGPLASSASTPASGGGPSELVGGRNSWCPNVSRSQAHCSGVNGVGGLPSVAMTLSAAYYLRSPDNKDVRCGGGRVCASAGVNYR